MPASPIAAPAGIFGKGSFIQKYSDVLIAVAIIIIVVMMIIPLPTLLLDLLICLNITIALLVIMSVIYNKEALDLSIFPSLLLITTLFRLALNISSTRLILLDGFAGEVITAFGNFVVGGNPVVGFIMFIILVGINFIVITKGSERVAEVSARFTLDAMPGKQMAIDADLNQGAITDAQAKERRIKIQREADFFGAMDGASKFVKGDAIAAIVIMMINITGGFVIGMLQRNLSAVQALQQYTLLTVGEGLVSQIPALLISTATGLIVTRAGAEGNLGADMVSQLFRNDRIFFILSGVLAFFAIVPGLPGVPFFALAAFCFFIGRALKASTQAAVAQERVFLLVGVLLKLLIRPAGLALFAVPVFGIEGIAVKFVMPEQIIAVELRRFGFRGRCFGLCSGLLHRGFGAVGLRRRIAAGRQQAHRSKRSDDAQCFHADSS